MKLVAVLLGVAGLILLWVPHYTLVGYFALAFALVLGGIGAAMRKLRDNSQL